MQAQEQGPYQAAPGCEEGVERLRTRLAPMLPPETPGELQSMTRFLTRNTTINAIIASLDDNATARQGLAMLNESMDVEKPTSVPESTVSECRRIARDLMVGIGIPFETTTSKGPAAPPARPSLLRRLVEA